MGQQPNIELEIADLPRPVAHPAPPRRWRPDRPGELKTPEEVPWGGMFGTTGPDTGFIFRILEAIDIPTADGEHRDAVEAALAAIAGARASHFGRGPTKGDVEHAMTLLGVAADGLPADVVERLRAFRRERLAGLGHDPGKLRAVVAAFPVEVIEADTDNLRSRMAAGDLPIAG